MHTDALLKPFFSATATTTTLLVAAFGRAGLRDWLGGRGKCLAWSSLVSNVPFFVTATSVYYNFYIINRHSESCEHIRKIRQLITMEDSMPDNV